MIPQQSLFITPIPAFEDNYIWLVHNGKHAIVVDPGDASPVIATLAKHRLTLTHILITHHHADHIGGVAQLLAQFTEVRVFAPENPRYTFKHQVVTEGDILAFDALDLQLRVISLHGHTLDHIGYAGDGIVFCGDTLFGAGCGRLFEGSPKQLFASLQKLAQLPAETKVYCTHEYTLTNIAFAMQVDKDNPQLLSRAQSTQQLRAQHQPSLPSTIGLERNTNPFLRCNSSSIQQALGYSTTDQSETRMLEVFTKLREMRNHF